MRGVNSIDLLCQFDENEPAKEMSTEKRKREKDKKERESERVVQAAKWFNQELETDRGREREAGKTSKCFFEYFPLGFFEYFPLGHPLNPHKNIIPG